jgi:hypothetical protein
MVGHRVRVSAFGGRNWQLADSRRRVDFAGAGAGLDGDASGNDVRSAALGRWAMADDAVCVRGWPCLPRWLLTARVVVLSGSVATCGKPSPDSRLQAMAYYRLLTSAAVRR